MNFYIAEVPTSSTRRMFRSWRTIIRFISALSWLGVASPVRRGVESSVPIVYFVSGVYLRSASSQTLLFLISVALFLFGFTEYHFKGSLQL